jgi:hypothetical protein
LCTSLLAKKTDEDIVYEFFNVKFIRYKGTLSNNVDVKKLSYLSIKHLLLYGYSKIHFNEYMCLGDKYARVDIYRNSIYINIKPKYKLQSGAILDILCKFNMFLKMNNLLLTEGIPITNLKIIDIRAHTILTEKSKMFGHTSFEGYVKDHIIVYKSYINRKKGNQISVRITGKTFNDICNRYKNVQYSLFRNVFYNACTKQDCVTIKNLIKDKRTDSVILNKLDAILIQTRKSWYWTNCNQILDVLLTHKYFKLGKYKIYPYEQRKLAYRFWLIKTYFGYVLNYDMATCINALYYELL